MKIVDSVRKAISDWEIGDYEPAMLHACNAIDGTAKRAYPNIKWNNERFKKLLRENYSILGPMALPGIDLVTSRFGVSVGSPTVAGDTDIADIIYAIHRCSHGHGDELPEGFELIPNAAQAGVTNISMDFVGGTVRLSDRVIFGLLGIAVFSPVNSELKTSDGCYLTYADKKFMIKDWWGRAAEFLEVVADAPPGVIIVKEYAIDGQMPNALDKTLHIKLVGESDPTL